jgi:tetratricopeptide (TPR) repeat protein
VRCLILLLGCPSLLFAQDLIAKGFDHFYNLEFDQSISTFREAVKQQPEDPNTYNHLAEAILYREMLHSGSLESELVTGNNPFLKRERMKPSEQDQKEFEGSLARTMQITEARLTTTPDDIGALYANGVSHGLRSNYNFLVRKAWMDALKDVTTARKRHNRITDLKPSMIDARLVQGVHDYVIGSLPWTQKMLGFLIGFRGDKQEGVKTLQLVAEKGDTNKIEAKVMLAAIYRRERRAADAIPLLKELLQLYPRNYLFLLEMVQMYADSGDKQKALDTLRELDRLKKAGSAGFTALPPEKINYARGNLLFWYRDYDVAIEELKKATAKANDLDLNAGSMSYLRLGQCYDMKQQRALAQSAYRASIALAGDSDAARQARQYLGSPYKRGKD